MCVCVCEVATMSWHYRVARRYVLELRKIERKHDRRFKLHVTIIIIFFTIIVRV